MALMDAAFILGVERQKAKEEFRLFQRYELRNAEVRISMDGRGRWMDNVFIERLWRSLKYECVYLHAFQNGSELRAGLGRWITNYKPNVRTRAWPGKPRPRPIGGSGNQIMGGMPPHDLMIKQAA